MRRRWTDGPSTMPAAVCRICRASASGARRAGRLLALGGALVLAAAALRAQDSPAATKQDGSAAAGAAAPAAAENALPEPAATPAAAVERLLRGLVEAAGDDLDVEARYRRLEPVIEATHDLQFIAELTIRREWDGLAAADRQRFVAAFERLSVMTYASRFGHLGKDMFKVTGQGDAAGDRAEVEAVLTTREGKVIPFEYLLHRADGGWKIVNILADRVSDLALKRAEYREVLEKGSIADLIRHIEKQTEDAARDADGKSR